MLGQRVVGEGMWRGGRGIPQMQQQAGTQMSLRLQALCLPIGLMFQPRLERGELCCNKHALGTEEGTRLVIVCG